MRLRLMIRDADNRVHEAVVRCDTANSSFLKLAAVNHMTLIEVRDEPSPNHPYEE